MDIIPDVKKWLKEMGYDRNVDDINFRAMITPATAPVWMQLIKNVRPKQEIEVIRKNIIINRLSMRSLPSGMAESVKIHPVEEIEIYNKKCELEKKLQIIKHRVRENDEKLKELMAQNRMKYHTAENLKHKIKCNERLTFLLTAKAAQLRNKIAEMEEMLGKAKSLTPVEETKPTDEREIIETLRECAQKLEVHMKKQRVKDENSTLLAMSTTCSVLDNSLFFTMSARKKLIPTETRRAFTPLQHNIVDQSSNIGDASYLMRSMNISNVNVTFNESKIKATLQQLVCSYNRQLIFDCFMQIFTECKTELSDVCLGTNEKIIKKDSNDLALMKLRGIHVKEELLIRKHRKSIKFLEEEIANYKKLITAHMDRSERARKTLQLQIEEAGLTAAVNFMHEEISKGNNLAHSDSDLRTLKEKIHTVKEKTTMCLREIAQLMDYFKRANEKLLLTRECTLSLFEKLNLFTENAEWMQLFTENIHSYEMQMFFDNFSLVRNRAVKFGDRKIYIDDLCTGSMPVGENVDQDTIHKLISVIHRPCCFPEIILLQFAQAKPRLKELENLKSRTLNVENVPKYAVQELKEREGYMEKALERLNRFIQKDGGNLTVHLKKLEEQLNIWMEMPFGKYLSKDRLVNQENYEFYEKQYDYYYNQL